MKRKNIILLGILCIVLTMSSCGVKKENKMAVTTEESINENPENITGEVPELRKSVAEDEEVRKAQEVYTMSFHSKEGENLFVKSMRSDEDSVTVYFEYVQEEDKVVQYEYLFADEEYYYNKALKAYEDIIIEKDDNALYMKFIVREEYPSTMESLKITYIENGADNMKYIE